MVDNHLDYKLIANVIHDRINILSEIKDMISFLNKTEDYDVDLSTTDYDNWVYHNIIGITSRSNFNIVNTDVIISYERDW